MIKMLIAILLFVIILLLLCRQKECLTGSEVYAKTGGKLDMGYEKFRNKIPEAHIVNYYDLKDLYKKGKYTPDNIDQILLS